MSLAMDDDTGSPFLPPVKGILFIYLFMTILYKRLADIIDKSIHSIFILSFFFVIRSLRFREQTRSTPPPLLWFVCNLIRR